MKRGKIIGIGALAAVLVAGGVYWYMESSAAEKTAQAVETVAV